MRISNRNGIRITDNGCGITDPQAILSFGRSCWEGAAETEHCAGMGMYALAQTKSSIWSRGRQGDGKLGAGWRVDLEPAHFRGEATAPVIPDERAPKPHGTRVTFDRRAESRAPDWGRIVGYLHGMKVWIDGQLWKPWNFFTGSEAWTYREFEGLRIGVGRHKAWISGMACCINYHGQVITDPALPELACLDRHWWTQVDTIGPTPLQLTLPQRHGVVDDEFHRRLCTEAERALYEALQESGERPLIGLDAWKRAKRLGIDVKAAPARLREWLPYDGRRNPDPQEREKAAPFIETGAETLIYEGAADIGEAEALARALERNKPDWKLVEHARCHEGYEWYDDLEKVVAMETEYVKDGKTVLMTKYGQDPPYHGENEMVDEIRILLQVRKGTQERLIRLRTDVGLGEAGHYMNPQTCGLKLARTHELTRSELEEILMRVATPTVCSEKDPDKAMRTRDWYQAQCALAAGRLVDGDGRHAGESAATNRGRGADQAPDPRNKGGHRAGTREGGKGACRADQQGGGKEQGGRLFRCRTLILGKRPDTVRMHEHRCRVCEAGKARAERLGNRPRNGAAATRTPEARRARPTETD